MPRLASARWAVPPVSRSPWPQSCPSRVALGGTVVWRRVGRCGTHVRLRELHGGSMSGVAGFEGCPDRVHARPAAAPSTDPVRPVRTTALCWSHGACARAREEARWNCSSSSGDRRRHRGDPRRDLQRARHAAQPHRRGARPDRGPAQAPARPHPEPRPGREGLHGLRAGRAHAGHRGSRQRGRGRRPGSRPAGRRREHAHGRPALAVRGRRELPGPQGEPERHAAPGGAHHDGEPDQLLPPALQRHGAGLQQHDPDDPERADRRSAGLHQARVLRCGARGRRPSPTWT